MNRPLKIFLSQIRIRSPSFMIKYPNMQDKPANIFIPRRNYEIGFGECEIHFAFSSFKLQRRALNHRESFRNSRQRDKRYKRYSTDQAWSFHSRGCAILTRVPRRRISACTRVLRPRSLNQWCLRSRNRTQKIKTREQKLLMSSINTLRF